MMGITDKNPLFFPQRSPGRQFIGWAVLLALLVGFLGWGYVLMRLTSASREGADQFENRVRHRLVREGFMPGRYRHWYPDRLDLAKHFLFYAPFGLMAGIACSVVRAAPRGSFPALLTPRRAAWALVGAGMLMASVDELRQVWVPSRSADVSDLLAGWMGIGFAFLVWKLGEKAIRISFPLCRRRLGLIPSHHQP